MHIHIQSSVHVYNLIITGKVIDKKGDPLTAVTVRLRGSLTAKATAADGSFIIGVPDGSGVLEFSPAFITLL